MDASEVLDGLVEFGKQDWLALWMIVEDVEAELEPDDDDETLELTVTLVTRLLHRGFLAGDSPVHSVMRFNAWPNQDPRAIGEYIRLEWKKRGGPPGWGDGPWFAVRLCPAGHA